MEVFFAGKMHSTTEFAMTVLSKCVKIFVNVLISRLKARFVRGFLLGLPCKREMPLSAEKKNSLEKSEHDDQVPRRQPQNTR